MYSIAKTTATRRPAYAKLYNIPAPASWLRPLPIGATLAQVAVPRSFSSMDTISASVDPAEEAPARKGPGVNRQLLSLLKQHKDNPLQLYELWNAIEQNPDVLEKVKSKTRMRKLLNDLKKQGKVRVIAKSSSPQKAQHKRGNAGSTFHFTIHPKWDK